MLKWHHKASHILHMLTCDPLSSQGWNMSHNPKTQWTKNNLNPIQLLHNDICDSDDTERWGWLQYNSWHSCKQLLYIISTTNICNWLVCFAGRNHHNTSCSPPSTSRKLSCDIRRLQEEKERVGHLCRFPKTAQWNSSHHIFLLQPCRHVRLNES